MRATERIIIEDDSLDRIFVQREPAPLLQLMPIFEPLGQRRGEWERAAANEVEYLPPKV